MRPSWRWAIAASARWITASQSTTRGSGQQHILGRDSSRSVEDGLADGKKRIGEGGEGSAAVADGLLLGEGHLGERAAVAVVGDEDGVVAEARRAAAARRRWCLDRTLGDHLAAVGAPGERDACGTGPCAAPGGTPASAASSLATLSA